MNVDPVSAAIITAMVMGFITGFYAGGGLHNLQNFTDRARKWFANSPTDGGHVHK